MSTAYCAAAPGHPFHGPYHDTEYGFPARDDKVLFERLVLEINQAGLSWLTVFLNFNRLQCEVHSSMADCSSGLHFHCC